MRRAGMVGIPSDVGFFYIAAVNVATRFAKNLISLAMRNAA
jgi:hypothetical protein